MPVPTTHETRCHVTPASSAPSWSSFTYSPEISPIASVGTSESLGVEHGRPHRLEPEAAHEVLAVRELEDEQREPHAHPEVRAGAAGVSVWSCSTYIAAPPTMRHIANAGSAPTAARGCRSRICTRRARARRKTITVSTFDTISTFMLDHVPAEGHHVDDEVAASPLEPVRLQQPRALVHADERRRREELRDRHPRVRADVVHRQLVGDEHARAAQAVERDDEVDVGLERHGGASGRLPAERGERCAASARRLARRRLFSKNGVAAAADAAVAAVTLHSPRAGGVHAAAVVLLAAAAARRRPRSELAVVAAERRQEEGRRRPLATALTRAGSR